MRKLGNSQKKVSELLGYVNDLINLTKKKKSGLTKDNIISILSDTPREKRKELHSNIMGTINNKRSIDKFRRSGTAEKQTEINEINHANSIEEIKHILNNPKYSHISWDPNNKGGIEVSAIIDQVITGKSDIKYIPAEIRQQVQKFINQ